MHEAGKAHKYVSKCSPDYRWQRLNCRLQQLRLRAVLLKCRSSVALDLLLQNR